MKKINLDNINYLRSRVAFSQKQLTEAIEEKAHIRSESVLKKADEEIARIKQWKTCTETELAKYETEAKEAKKLVEAGWEIILAYVWLDDYGCRDSKVDRTKFNSLEEAEKAYHKIKKGNGSYIEAWIEVREMGEFERIENIYTKIEMLKAELKELCGDD